MKSKQFPVFVILLMAMSLTGCMSFTTLESPKTLEPGDVQISAGVSAPVEKKVRGVTIELGTRVGIANNFDIGGKYILPSLLFLDAKYQIIKDPVYLSADLGWSHFSYSGPLGNSRGKTTCWYPMIITGQESWYVAVKRVYMETEGEIELIGIWKVFGNGWISTNVTGGAVIGEKIRIIPEVNLVIPDHTGKTIVVPALGLQFIL